MPLTLVLVIALTQGSLAPDSGELHLRNLRQLTFGGQNAEAYFSASGRLLIFQRQGPDEQCDQMYMMGTDGGGLHRVSSGRGRTTCGYFFDQDRRIFYSSTEHAGAACPPRPDYSRGYVWALYDYDIYTADADGSGARLQPYVHPDGKRIIFASNYRNPESRNFDLYLVDLRGGGLEQVTTSPEFDAFPMFLPDGRRLVWASNRHGSVPHETNIFIADWVEQP